MKRTALSQRNAAVTLRKGVYEIKIGSIISSLSFSTITSHGRNSNRSPTMREQGATVLQVSFQCGRRAGLEGGLGGANTIHQPKRRESELVLTS